MKKIMKKALSLMLVLAMMLVPMTAMAANYTAPSSGDGSAESPYVISADGTTAYGVTIDANATVFVQVDDYNATINGVASTQGSYSLWRSRFETPVASDESGVATITLTDQNMFMIVNNVESANVVIFTATASGTGATVGTVDNPEEVTFSKNQWTGAYGANLNKELAAGNSGYYYRYTATADGLVSVNVSAFDAEWNAVGWMYNVNNTTASKYGDYHFSDDDPLVNYEYVEVKAGDVVDVFVTTYDPNNMFNSPAGIVYVNFGFSTVGSGDYPEDVTVGTLATTIVENAGEYYYLYTATEAGTLTVAMDTENNANGWQYSLYNLTSYVSSEPHTSADDPVVSTENITVAAGDEVQIRVATFDSTNPWAIPAGTVNWTLSFVAGSAGGNEGGNQGGSGDGNQGETTEPNYFESETVLVVGDNACTVSGIYEYTVYTFVSPEAGKYTISTNDGEIGIVGYNWVNGNPNADIVKETSFVWNCTDAQQEIRVAVSADVNVANIKIEKTGEAELNTIDWKVYENKTKPATFKFDGDVDKLLDTYVDVSDQVVDKAVLGKDGYYHLNSADGEVLYVNLNDTLMSLVKIVSTGKLSAVYYDENKEVKEAIDFTSALLEYLGVKDIAELEAKNFGTNPVIYPLTEDLMTMLQKVGETNKWYGTDGFIKGTEADDAWMFACYYVKGANTLSGTMSNTTSPSTGDSANVAVWAIVMVVAAGAAFVVADSKKRAR